MMTWIFNLLLYSKWHTFGVNLIKGEFDEWNTYRTTHPNSKESYILQAPRVPQLVVDHFKHVLSIRAPKYTGARIPPAMWDDKPSIHGTFQVKLAGRPHQSTFQ